MRIISPVGAALPIQPVMSRPGTSLPGGLGHDVTYNTWIL
jgi:hypothetical protein